MDEFLDDEEDDDDAETSASDGGANSKKPWDENTDSEEENDKKRRRRRKKFDSSDESSANSDNNEAVDEKPVLTIASRSTRSARAARNSLAASAEMKEMKKKRSNSKDDSNDDNDVVENKPPISRGSLRSGINFKDASANPEHEEEQKPEPEFNDWYDEFLKPEDESNVELSGKLVIMLEIIANAEVVGDKVLVFTQSLASLDLIESALGGGTIGGNQLNWCHGIDYFRMDGSTPVQRRKRWSDTFNDPDNDRYAYINFKSFGENFVFGQIFLQFTFDSPMTMLITK